MPQNPAETEEKNTASASKPDTWKKAWMASPRPRDIFRPRYPVFKRCVHGNCGYCTRGFRRNCCVYNRYLSCTADSNLFLQLENISAGTAPPRQRVPFRASSTLFSYTRCRNHLGSGQHCPPLALPADRTSYTAVSYTHLTLPTILLV